MIYIKPQIRFLDNAIHSIQGLTKGHQFRDVTSGSLFGTFRHTKQTSDSEQLEDQFFRDHRTGAFNATAAAYMKRTNKQRGTQGYALLHGAYP